MSQPARSGSEFRINGIPGVYLREQHTKIVGLQDGSFIAVWHRFGSTGESIQAQIYNADGTMRGSEIALTDPTMNTKVGNPDVTVLTDGRILVAWDKTNIPRTQYEIQETDIAAQLLTSDGAKIGGAFSGAGILGSGVDEIPRLTALANGEFMIAWYDRAENSFDSRHLAYRYSSTGSLNILAAIDMEYKSAGGDVTGLKNGGYAQAVTVLDTSSYSDGSGKSIYMNFYRDGRDTYISEHGRVNVSTDGDQHQVSAVTLSNGNVVFVWTDENTAADGSGSCVKARIFTGLGKPMTGEILVNTTKAGYQHSPVIEALSDGGFVIAFVSRLGTDHDIRVATFNADGGRRGDDFLAKGSSAGNQTDPSLAALKDGRFVVSWTDQDLSTRAQVFGTPPTPENPPPGPVPVPDTLIGDAGDNILDGTKVRGLIDGLGGRDTATYQAAESGVIILLAHPQFNAGHAAGDTFKNIEVIVGSAHNDQLIGNDDAHEFQGGAGDDLLMGAGGADTLIGGEDDDVLMGGEGADVIDGGTGINVASYAEAAGRVTASLQSSGVNTGEAAGDTYQAIQNLTGSNFGDTLIGDSSNNTLVGGEGNDHLIGGEGSDHLIGGNGDDTLDGGGGIDILEGGAGRNTYVNADQDHVIGSASGGFDVIQIKANFILNEASAIEGIEADPTAGAINLTGNSSANTILGNNATNTLSGLGGDDLLSGAGGKDKLLAGLGNDRLSGGAGQDSLTGGAGRDVFSFDDKETASSRSKADIIIDFTGRKGDRIDLKAMDASIGKKGDQKFSFIGEKEFTKAGQVRFEKTKKETYIYLNTDSDKAAEAVIRLKGALDLQKGWFVL
ncbi:Ca2+-binding RTX toxin-like protein [Microvirga lupini]|uniref:Ca2+-binding RTX toxin-like protein n=1 Tax=Microvirga lupini TaxID=420324 RepID=A0A7W4YW77_9HYPH|nr:calcium-binding protein [Microvirga lupini]MBB3017929.1 Ca2+-binding RTX toxin-like protein [Microvirga lupini]